MGQCIYINSDAPSLLSARVKGPNDLRTQNFAEFVAGDKIELDLFLVGNNGLLDIQSYEEVKVAIGDKGGSPLVISEESTNIEGQGARVVLSLDTDHINDLLEDSDEIRTCIEIKVIDEVENKRTILQSKIIINNQVLDY